MMKKQVVHTAKAPAAIGPYSHGVRAGDFLFVSGQLPIDPATGKMIDGDIGELTARCIENVAAILEEAGGDLSSVVKVTIYTTDLGKFSQINQAYGAYFREDHPARAVVEVKGLPLGSPVEMDAIALLPEPRQ